MYNAVYFTTAASYYIIPSGNYRYDLDEHLFIELHIDIFSRGTISHRQRVMRERYQQDQTYQTLREFADT